VKPRSLPGASGVSLVPRSNPGHPKCAHGSKNELLAAQSDWLELAQEKLAEAKELVKQTEHPYEPHIPDWPSLS
ncbi:MAG: hypothetical protein O3A00_03850, partial [Planctomycetota bacterium]|nr:hypothetical protein [Planctomycetota bacterium]